VYFTIIRAIGKEKIVGVRSEKVYWLSFWLIL
jgi:hypothetical protein